MSSRLFLEKIIFYTVYSIIILIILLLYIILLPLSFLFLSHRMQQADWPGSWTPSRRQFGAKRPAFHPSAIRAAAEVHQAHRRPTEDLEMQRPTYRTTTDWTWTRWTRPRPRRLRRPQKSILLTWEEVPLAISEYVHAVTFCNSCLYISRFSVGTTTF